jgi:membrane associated rhomboid family serine protease
LLNKQFNTVALIIAIVGLVFIINQLMFKGMLNQFGIIPRNPNGLIGVFISPLLHQDLNHLFNNLVGLSIFSLLTLAHGPRYFWRTSFTIIFLGGIAVWLMGRSSIHIGASGWIFGLWALNIANAWYNRSFKTFLIALLIIFFWGGMVVGVLPSQPNVSFEAHLFGALAGIFAATRSQKKLR